MNPVPIQVPQGARLHNFLFRTSNPAYLTQDVLTVELANGYCISAGWFPEHDPNGQYYVNVFYQSWDRQKQYPVTVKTAEEVAQTVQALVRVFGQDNVVASSARTERSSFNVVPADA